MLIYALYRRYPRNLQLYAHILYTWAFSHILLSIYNLLKEGVKNILIKGTVDVVLGDPLIIDSRRYPSNLIL